MQKRKGWSKIIEEHGVEVRLFERDGTIYRDVTLERVVTASGKVRTRHDKKSLKHGNRDLAETQARALCKHLAAARLVGRTSEDLSIAQLFAAYRQHRLPALTRQRQREGNARMTMFAEAWGSSLNISDLDQTRVDAYCRKRRELAIVAPGLRPDAEGKKRRGYRAPKAVRDGALDAEFRWLASVVNWARTYRMNSRPLLGIANPLDGVKLPREANALRPVASAQRYTATIEHADTVDAAGRLRCILALARYTGRRESALCALRADDLLLEPTRLRAALAAAGMDERLVDHMPHGAIRWRAESDKQGYLFVSPIGGQARAELDLYLLSSPAREGDVPLFPAPRQKDGEPVRPIRRETVMKWLVRAESLGELPKLRGGCFHPYRRLWATERKHLPDVDVAAAGGWRDTQALRLSYKHADPATVLRVVEGS